jgi:hypothetical protein
MEGMRNAYEIIVGKSEMKRPLGRPRVRWKVNVKMDSREICCGDWDWIQEAQVRVHWPVVLNTLVSFRVSYKASER